MSHSRTLVFIPTYNERENVRLIIEGLRFNLPGVPILFCDDNSPDGTADLLDALALEFGDITVHRRPSKLGIGSAHKFGIAAARRAGYDQLLTLDCDLTHQPSDVARMLRHGDADLVVGTRFARSGSLAHWNWIRSAITRAGHIATRHLLDMPFDATGALRRYRLDRLGTDWLDQVESNGYAFFFESMLVLHRGGAAIEEIPIDLPKRTYGSSKMSVIEVARSCRMLLWLTARARRMPRPKR